MAILLIIMAISKNKTIILINQLNQFTTTHVDGNYSVPGWKNL